MIKNLHPDFSKFPAEVEKMNVEQLTTLLEAIKNDFQPLRNEEGVILKDFEPNLRPHYLDLCNYMYDQRFTIIAKYDLDAEIYRYPEVAEILLSELINLKLGKAASNIETDNTPENDTNGVND